MMLRHLTVPEVAAELGRSPQWLYSHWRRLVQTEGMPPPVRGDDPPLVWSAAQFYAWLDRDLPPKLQAASAAFRAAAATYISTRSDPHAEEEIDRARDALDARFGKKREIA